MVWPYLKVFGFSKVNPAGHSERKKQKRQTKEEVGRQYQRVDSIPVHSTLPAQLGQLKSGQDRKGWCEFICGAPTTFQW